MGVIILIARLLSSAGDHNLFSDTVNIRMTLRRVDINRFVNDGMEEIFRDWCALEAQVVI